MLSGLTWGANCTGSGQKTQFPLPTTLSQQRDAPVGTVLYDTNDWIGTGEASVSCFGAGTFKHSHGYYTAATPTAQANVYETGVPGVGIKVAWNNSANQPSLPMSGGVYMGYPRYEVQAPGGKYVPAQRWWIQLIKTGPIATGTFNIPPIRVYYDNVLTNELTFPASQLVFTKKGCRLLTPNTTVQLPIANLHHFSGVGSGARPKAFNLELDCDPDVRISYRVDGLQAADSVLKNSEGSGMARGVGVQLLKGAGGGTPLVLGAKAYHLNIGAAGGSSVIPLIARYYQVEPTVSPGAVITTATLTLFYE
ncbi:fimbrial protein [Pseudomonas tohonis]|uniref:Fimbrial protein n=2 Tax=Pseudomonas tohonis TaxID=2725477 RepID=A0A6J4E1T8_9PSED|nr:fimbrial protein [Pseudomonas tohonis]GJN53523.1 fimbrial protein [Pseudomonas tohonis]